MAKQTTQTSQPETQKRRGRPPADPSVDPKQTATVQLMDATNRVCAIMVDRGTNTIQGFGAKCARAGVDRAKVQLALDGIQAALTELEEGIDRAYLTPTARPVRSQRVNLLD